MPPDPAPRPEGPLYAIGDLHGCAALMERVIEAIDRDMADQGYEAAQVVFLGDYVDRGEESRAVLEGLFGFARALPDHVTCLMGNHEKMMLDFLDRPEERGRRWLRYGGLQTLASFGVGGVTERSGPDALADCAARLREAMHEGLEDWLRALPLQWRSGDVVCVHAAMDPVVPPEMQQARDLLWGMPAFYQYERPDGIWTVHGHNVVDRANVHQRRIACDTGAYHSGRLSAAAIYPEEAVRFLTV